MKYIVMNNPYRDIQQTPIERVLYNRGLTPYTLMKYLHTTDECINGYMSLGEENIRWAASYIAECVEDNNRAIIVIDSDADGYTSSALLLNYLHRVFPAWVENNVDYFIHSGKQHGLSDCCDMILEKEYSIVLLPDSSSNDYEFHQRLHEKNIAAIILDHHEAEKISDKAIVVNNQLSDYPNKFLSGVGVVWQFCRFLDDMLGVNYADDFLDLVAIGNQGDMMSMLSIETKHLIWKGLEKDRIKNPFIYEIIKKNNFSLSKGDYVSSYNLAATPMGASFFIVPFINAIVRSGTQEEKAL